MRVVPPLRSIAWTLQRGGGGLPVGRGIPVARGIAGGAGDCRWRGGLPVARGIAGGAGDCRWRGGLPVARVSVPAGARCRIRWTPAGTETRATGNPPAPLENSILGFAMNSETSIKRLGVAGAGTMGAGIAQISACAGIETTLYD